MKIKKISDLKLLKKFLLSYFLLILIPLFLLSSLTYVKVAKILENYITYSTKQAFDQTYSFLSYKLFRIADVSNIISNDSNSTTIDTNLTTILGRDPNSYSINEQIRDMYYLRKFLSSFENNVDIYSVKLYVNDNFIYSSENINIFTISQAKSSKWYTIFKEDGKKNLWCPTSYLEDKDAAQSNLLSITSSIKNPNNFSEDIGFLRVDFKRNLIDNILNKTNAVKGSLTYLQNSKGIIIASSDYSLVKKYSIDTNLTNKLSMNNGDLEPITIRNTKCLVKSSLINDTDWYMITVVPYNSIIGKIDSIRNELTVLMIVIGAIAYTLAYYFSNSLIKRISKLIKAMRSVNDGNLNSLIENFSKDEIGELIENYNYMIRKMSVLIEEQYKSGKEVKNAELKALRAQINPHFLYNTLDMINWMAFKNMNKEISTAVKSLASFYKLSLNKGKDIVSIKDEIAHVSHYVQIQNMRYSNRINLIVDVPKEIYDCSILKITLQPIVENSILHGILGRGNVNGTIFISGKIENNEVTLSVKDDGIGIPEENIDKILSGDVNSKKGSGYGIKNINQRLKLSYGEKYGLSFKSQLNIGTTVEITFPAEKHSDSNLAEISEG